MATKLQNMTELARQTTEQLVMSIDNWRSFLDSAAWMYKYPWHEQVLIYAQRPDVKACAPIELWNISFRRWVNKGAKGIALIDDSADKPSLRYVFDVSDTNSRYNIPFKLWDMQEKYEEQIAEELANHFGDIESDGQVSFPDQLRGIIHNAVNDNSADYFDELLRSIDGSALVEYDDLGIKALFEKVLEVSVFYCTMTRLGYDAQENSVPDDLLPVLDFNTPETISQLGAATSDISEMVLRQIERSVRSIKKQERDTLANIEKEQQNVDRKAERSDEYGTGLQAERGLSDSRYSDGRAAHGEYRQIRTDEEIVPQGASERDLQHPAVAEQADSAPRGDRPGSEDAGRSDLNKDGTDERRDGELESDESDGLGATDEQHQSTSGGNRPKRPDPQLTLFLSAEEQIEAIEQAEAENASAFSLSQEDIDSELLRGSGFEHGKYRIYRFYQTHPDTASVVAFLKHEYGIGGHSHDYPDGTRGFIDHDAKGLTFKRWNNDRMRICLTNHNLI